MAQLSYVHKPLTKCMEHRTLFQLLDARATEHPTKEAIVLYDNTRKRSSLTFGEYQIQSRALAASLLKKGLGRGDRVAITSPNNLEYVISMMACLRIGANVINIIQGLSSEDILEVLTVLKCNALICFVDADPVEGKAVSVAVSDVFTSQKPNGDLPNFREVITIGSSVECDSSRDHIHLYSELLSSGYTLEKTDLTKVEEKVQMDDNACLLLTSGSTGVPKTVQYTHQGLVMGTIIAIRGVKVTSDSRIYNDSPFSWIPALGGGLFLCSVLGLTAVFIPPVTAVRDRSVDFVLSVLQDEKCTVAFLAPFHLYDIVKSEEMLPKYNLSCLRYGIVGGQPAPKALSRKILSLIPWMKLVLVYASTEFMLLTFQEVDKDNIDSLPYGWMEVSPGAEIKITSDKDGRILPVGAIGEVQVRGRMLFQEYLENQEATARLISRTGWFNSLDMGEMNQNGLVKIYGRKGDAINRATDTFYPAEWERNMMQHPLVAQVQMVGVPDKRLYEEVCACVVLKEHNNLEGKRAQLEEWYDEQWPPNADGLSWKPGYTIFLEKLPRTRTNKPDRRALKKMAIQMLGLAK